MSQPSSLRPHSGLGRIMPLIGRLTSLVRCQVSRICQAAGYRITPEEADTLMINRHCNGISQTHLATILGKDKAAVTRLIDALVRSRLVGRVRDEQDRRVIWARITEEGERAFEDIWPELMDLSGQALAGIDEEDLRHLERTLTAINTNLGRIEGADCA